MSYTFYTANEISSAAEYSIARKSLAELLGQDWEKRAFSSIDEVFHEEDLLLILGESERRCGEECQKLNEMFSSLGLPYSAFTRRDGESEELLIRGDFSDFRVVMLAPVVIFESNGRAAVGVSKLYFLAPRGAFCVTDLLDSLESGLGDSVFLISSDRQHHLAASLHNTKENWAGVTLGFPATKEAWATYFHEISHNIRLFDMKRKRVLFDRSLLSKIFEWAMSDIYKIREVAMSHFDARLYKVSEERGSWAIGASLLKTAFRKVGLSLGSRLSLISFLRHADSMLSTYDEVPYALSDHPHGSQTVPAFSRANRNAARKLHRLFHKRGTTSAIRNFNVWTGKPMVADLQAVVNQVQEDLRKARRE